MDIKSEYKRKEYDDGKKRQWVERRLIIVPGCCEASWKGRGVFLQLSHDDIYENENGQENCIPTWELYGGFRYRGDCNPESIPVKFCPYCGRKMPEIRRRREPFFPIAKVIDGGYHCDTCGERLRGCHCWPCEAHWEVDDE